MSGLVLCYGMNARRADALIWKRYEATCMSGVRSDVDDQSLPAFSWPTRPEDQPHLTPVPWHEVTPEWAWGGATGAGIKACIVDSGVDGSHPAIGGALRGSVIVERGDAEAMVRDDAPTDVFGHGTACAGIIHRLAPAAELYSVRVLGPNLKAGGDAFIAGLRWAVENRMDVINLSLSTRKQDHALALHELADTAYFQNTILVASANNTPVHSYPWLFSSVISVACHVEKDPYTFYYNPAPPVEFTAPGVDIEVSWLNGATMVGTGNSYAAPHIAGLVACIMSKHRALTPFQIKTVLYYTARNVREALRCGPEGG